MKRGYAALFGERVPRLRRDLHCLPTSSGEFIFKNNAEFVKSRIHFKRELCSLYLSSICFFTCCASFISSAALV